MKIVFLVINAENAAHRSEKFATMATRTRQAYLKDLTLNQSSNTTIEPVQKFCKFTFFFLVKKVICMYSIAFYFQRCCHLAVRKKRGGGQDFSLMHLNEGLFAGK